MGAARPAPAWASAAVLFCSAVVAASTAGRASAFTVTSRRFGGAVAAAGAGAIPAASSRSRHRARRPTFAPVLSLASSSDDGETADDESADAGGGGNTIVIALTAAEGTNDDLRAALSAHPVVGMMGVTLDVREMPCVVAGGAAAAAPEASSGDGASGDDDEVKGEEVEQGEEDDQESESEEEEAEAEQTTPPAAVVDFSQEQLDAIDEIDLACFGCADAVVSWLHNVDVARGFTDTEDDEVIDDEINEEGNGGVMAACATQDLYNECLGSGRWEERKIYYPAKKEGDESLTWADSAAMAIGDVMERKFWGGGW